jgi:hypothetical protein
MAYLCVRYMSCVMLIGRSSTSPAKSFTPLCSQSNRQPSEPQHTLSLLPGKPQLQARAGYLPAINPRRRYLYMRPGHRERGERRLNGWKGRFLRGINTKSRIRSVLMPSPLAFNENGDGIAIRAFGDDGSDTARTCQIGSQLTCSIQAFYIS